MMTTIYVDDLATLTYYIQHVQLYKLKQFLDWAYMDLGVKIAL